MEETIILPTIELLLNQVYAAHKQKVRELEEQLQTQRNNSDNCKQCDELKTALTECREKYFEALQQQKHQIESLEKRLADVKLIENSKNKRSVATQACEENSTKDIIIDVADRTSSSNSGTSRKRLLQSTTPPSARKKGCIIEETLSEASSTLLKNNDNAVTVRNDLLLIETTCNSIEQEPNLVLVPDSPENKGMDHFDEIRVLSSHMKVSKWLSEVEVPETVPFENVCTFLPETGHVEILSLSSLDNKDEDHKSNASLLNDHIAEIKKERSVKVKNEKLIEDLTHELISSKKHFGVKQFHKNNCRTVKSLDGSPIPVRSESVSKADVNSPGHEIGKSPVCQVSNSDKKVRETWCTKSKYKVPRQTKLKLYFGQRSNIPAKSTVHVPESQDLDATMLPIDRTKAGRDVAENNPVCKKRVVGSSSPENKENVNGSCAESDSGSEDLLLANKNCLLNDVSPETKNNGTEIPALRSKLNNSFDAIPSKSEKIPFKVKEPTVRGRAARDQLRGHDCDYCLKYYDNLGLSEEERKERLKICSKHRANNSLRATPEHYWEIGFPDTPECQERGYLNVTQKVQLRPRRRRPLK